MKLPGQPYVTPFRLLLFVSVCVVAWGVLQFQSWQQHQRQPFNYGAPTPLASDQSMRTAVCEIRRELFELEQPIVEAHDFHEAWSEYKFAAGRFDYGSLYQLTLTDHAMAFVLRHSRVELIAALSPLLLDAEQGGRAAAVLGGLPARSKAALRNTSAMAEAVRTAQLGDPSRPIEWVPPGEDQYYHPHIPGQLYGLSNIGGRLERSVPRNYSGSFEERLEKILLARSELPSQFIASPDVPRDGTRLTYEEMLANIETPTADPRFLKYLSDFPREDILITVFPMLGQSADGTNSPVIDILWANGWQDQYWPMVIGNPLIKDNPYNTLIAAVGAELINLCSSSR